MSNTLLGIFLALGSALVIAISQLILKIASQKTWPSRIREYLNVPVVSAYILSFGATFAGVFSMKFIPVAVYAALMGAGQIFVPLLSSMFLGEKMNRRKWLGVAVIVVGIVLVSI